MPERAGQHEAEVEAHFIDLVKRIRSAATDDEAWELFRPNYPPDRRQKKDLWKRVGQRQQVKGVDEVDDRIDRAIGTAHDLRAAIEAVRSAKDENAAIETLRTLIPEILEYDWSDREDLGEIGMSKAD